MITHSASPATRTVVEKKNNIDIHATAGITIKDKSIVSGRRIFKWFGVISTVLLSAAALAPNIFRIPANLQPWVFLTAVFWFLAFCSGMFNL